MEKQPEKRLRPRFDIKSRLKYRVTEAEDFEEGKLDNLSEIGAFIWIKRKIAIGARIYLVVESDNPEELPIRCTATVVRESSEKKEAYFGYGCQIEDIIDPNASENES